MTLLMECQFFFSNYNNNTTQKYLTYIINHDDLEHATANYNFRKAITCDNDREAIKMSET